MNGAKKSEYQSERFDDAISESLREISVLPDGFRDDVAARINSSRFSEKKQWTKLKLFPKIKYAALAAAFVAVLYVSGSFLNYIGQSGNSEYSAADGETAVDGLGLQNTRDMAASNPKFELVNEEFSAKSGEVEISAEVGSEKENQSKIIENFWYGIKTEEFDLAKKSIEEAAQISGGYVESMNTYGTGDVDDPRSASFSVKIPSSGMEGFGEVLKGLGEVYRESKSAEDVTKHYGEIEVEIANYEEAERRYLALYEKAETIEDMLLIENELGRIRNYIDVRKAQIKSYDHQVAYATYSIEIQEVIEEKPVVTAEPGTLDKAKYAFISSLNAIIKFAQDGFVWLVAVLPVAALLLAALGVIYLIAKIIIKKSAKSRIIDNENGQQKNSNN